jgi:hypothetical protein
MAVTNFKASTANTRLGDWDATQKRYDPYLDPDDEGEDITFFWVPPPPGLRPTVKVTWEDPQALGEALRGRGFAIPKTTTVLASIWPCRHLILDRWDLGTAIGLQGADEDGRATGDFSVAQLDNLWSRAIKERGFNWQNYQWFRQTALETAKEHGTRLIDVERTLLILGRLAKKERGWRNWSRRLEDLIQEPDTGKLEAWEPDTG